MKILTDVDDTLLDWFAGFKNFVEYKTGKKLPPERPSSFILDNYLDTDGETTRSLITEFNSGNWRFGALTPIAHSEKVLPYLNEIGFEIHAITAVCDTPQTKALRNVNLHSVYGDIFTKVHCSGLFQSKKPYLEKYEPTVWVEDNFSHAMSGLECGHKVYMIRRPHNVNDRHNSDVIWVDSWFEVVKDLI